VVHPVIPGMQEAIGRRILDPKNNQSKPDVVAYACNPSYAGGIDGRMRV
jgi:hypothetical protein